MEPEAVERRKIQFGIIPINQIEFGERFRVDYGNLKELIQSFKDNEIIQPLAVMKREVTNGEQPYILLAGGRRYRAATEGGFLEVPCRIYDRELSELEIRSIELAENVHRKDLDWFEKINLTKRVHDLQIEIYGKKTSTSPDASGWSQKDTAKLLGVDKTLVAKDLALAQAIETIPVLKECKTADEASKLLKKMQKMATHEKIATEVMSNQKQTPEGKLRSQLINSYIVENFFNGVRAVPDGSIGFVEVDPPYGIDLKANKNEESSMDLGLAIYNEVDKDKYLSFMEQTLRECYRVMETNSWLVLWFGPDPWFEPLHEIATKIGFIGRRIPAIWTKDSGQTKRQDMYLANSYEMFFYFRKGEARIIKQGRSNLFNFKPVPPQFKVHPTERPIELTQEIISTFVLPNVRVMVPFLGSGNTNLAANNLGMQSFGYDIAKEYKDSYVVKVSTGKIGEFTSYTNKQ